VKPINNENKPISAGKFLHRGNKGNQAGPEEIITVAIRAALIFLRSLYVKISIRKGLGRNIFQERGLSGFASGMAVSIIVMFSLHPLHGKGFAP
jgi:hypothetical protein